jgi:hypothetical protein
MKIFQTLIYIDKRLICAIVPLVISSNVISKEISYDFVQGTYASVSDSSIDGVDIDADALSVSGSFTVAPNIAFTAGFRATDYERYLGVSIDTTELTFGVTAFTSVAQGTSIFGNFSVLKADIEATDGFDTFEDDDTGNVITVGLRHLVTDIVELDFGFSRVDVFDDTGNTFALGARFYASQNVSLGIGYSTGDDVDAILFNGRVDFK